MGFSLNTERLRLRDYEPGDLAVVQASFLDPDQKQFNLTGQANESYVENLFNFALAQPHWPMRQAYDLAIVLPSDQAIGFCCLKTSPENSACGQLSWHISKDYWGMGYATEAAAQLLEFGFLALGFSVLSATAFADNLASIRVMDKLGMKAANNSSVANWWRGLVMGETRPIVRYEIQKEQWLAARLSQAQRQPCSFSRAA